MMKLHEEFLQASILRYRQIPLRNYSSFVRSSNPNKSATIHALIIWLSLRFVGRWIFA